MRHWDDLTEADRADLARRWTGQVERVPAMAPGTMAWMPATPPCLLLPWERPRYVPSHHRLMLCVAPDVWDALALLGMPAASEARH